MKKLMLLGLLVLLMGSMTGCGLFTKKMDNSTLIEAECELEPIFEVEFNSAD